EAELAERVVEFAEGAQEPGVDAGLRELLGRRRLRPLGSADRQGRRALARLDRQLDVAVAVADRAALLAELTLERPPLDALPAALVGAGRRDLGDARIELLGEARARPGVVDEPPLLRLLALDAFGEGREHVGEVAAHLALVDEPREPAGAR